ncbi:Neu5Ac-binding protein [Thalassovita gelatinovora]|uniref:Neu5Ac-binding protein n=1 Tax=Thalassovita gelatinovora TaxID=53501 RepID=A0A0P1FW36_THAGE|nr:TRAP transporter substrate-binding protein [Thalassovita gelatinovora]QIZ80709.1 TRAP transporter substrate-binding protein [Thalassovita gelatinovora]CUH65304.1 Neu5Ac-binding protein [Thalassovita gelatinovora]SEQ89076.1 TRAP-type mannitol/chloroaromatic compound transport system, substrate-binding protein [Thalassovita gelatinovora]
MKRLPKLFCAATVALSSVVATAAIAKDKLDIQSAWPLNMAASGANAEYLGKALNAASGGELDATVYGAGKLVPSLQIFDAVQQGTLDAGITSPLYVAGRFPAVQLFGGIPFGPDAIEHTAWIYNGGGREIWEEIYAAQGVKTIPCGLMDAEAGGWYNFEINSVDDLKGKKIRFAGLAGEALAELGASIVLLPSSEIYPSLEKGIIDGTELSLPAIDILLGFQQVAKYYYLPGWHQPAAMNELIINMAKWDSLSDANKALIEESCKAVNMTSITSTVPMNGEAVAQFKEAGVELRSFTPEVLAPIEAAFDKVIAEQVKNDPEFKRVWDSLEAYRAKTGLGLSE